MIFQFRAEIRFDEEGNKLNGISFDRFLPSGSESRELGATGIKVALAVDPKRHRGWVIDIDFANIDKYQNVTGTGLFVFMWLDLDEVTAKAVQSEQQTEVTRALGQKLLDAIHAVHDAVVDLVRNDRLQAHISPRRYSDQPLQQQLLKYSLLRRIPEGWKIFSVEANQAVVDVQMRQGVSPKDWERLLESLSRGRFGVKPHRRLLANALTHFQQHDLRAAVIEAVAAWEMVMNKEAPCRLTEVKVNYAETDWRNLIEKAGLRASTRLFINLATHLPKLSEHGDQVLAMIEMRNTVIHQGHKRPDASRVMQLLQSVRTACLACEVSHIAPG